MSEEKQQVYIIFSNMSTGPTGHTAKLQNLTIFHAMAVWSIKQ